MAQGSVRTGIDEFREAALRCPIPVAVDLIGEKWAFLILRGAINNLKHFEEFQAGLGIARNILSDRLTKMVSGGILQRTPDPTDKRKVIYALTDKGKALMPVVLAMRQWGEQWGGMPTEVVLVDRKNGKPVRKICVMADDGRVLSDPDDLVWASSEAAQAGKAA